MTDLGDVSKYSVLVRIIYPKLAWHWLSSMVLFEVLIHYYTKEILSFDNCYPLNKSSDYDNLNL